MAKWFKRGERDAAASEPEPWWREQEAEAASEGDESGAASEEEPSEPPAEASSESVSGPAVSEPAGAETETREEAPVAAGEPSSEPAVDAISGSPAESAPEATEPSGATATPAEGSAEGSEAAPSRGEKTFLGGVVGRFKRSKTPPTEGAEAVAAAPPAQGPGSGAEAQEPAGEAEQAVAEAGQAAAEAEQPVPEEGEAGTTAGLPEQEAIAEPLTGDEAAGAAAVAAELFGAPQMQALPPAAGTPLEPVFVAPAPPPPATLIAGSALVAVVSRGPDPTTPPLSMIPNVTGLAQEDALDGLQELGVATQIVLAYSSEVKSGYVIAQYPTPGTPFPETQSAVLVVSRGTAAVPHVVVLPNLVGLHEDDAVRDVKQLGLEPFTVDAYDLEVPPGTVLTQVPSAESLAIAPVEHRALWPWLVGAAALVLLLFGAFLFWRLTATYPVPSVIGQTQVTAQQTLDEAGFTVGSIVSSPVAGVPRGAVASQEPSPNVQAQLRTPVELVVSSGEPLVVIPNVVGLSESEATTDLVDVDLTSEVIRAYDATVPAGNIVAQYPIAGDQVLPNTVVGLVVSRGRPPSIGAMVPNVTGKSQSSATSAVKKAGLTAQVFTVPSASVKSGYVVGQLPTPGSFVAKQSQVYLFVSRGTISSTTTLTASVPNLIGQTQIQAITNINSAGLIAVVSQAYSSAIPPGIVYAQVPQPGAVVSRDTQVGIIVSQGPAPLQ